VRPFSHPLREALCEENIKDFDPKINEENLSNCLQSLKDFYYDLSLRDIYCENEAEFRSYEILLHLNDGGILRDVKNYRKEIRDSSQVKLRSKPSIHINLIITLIFQLAEKANYLMSCVMHRYFTHVRQQAFKYYESLILLILLQFKNILITYSLVLLL